MLWCRRHFGKGASTDACRILTGFQAIILVCLNAIPSDQCTEETATDVLSKHVETELGCASGWQEVIGRSAQSYEIGRDVYVRTICRRSREAR